MDSQALGLSRRFACERHDGPTQGVEKDLHVRPGDVPAPARADDLEDGLFGGKATGDERDRVIELSRPLLLGLGQDAVEETLTMTLQHLGNPGALDEVDSVADDGHGFAYYNNVMSPSKAGRHLGDRILAPSVLESLVAQGTRWALVLGL